MMPFHLTVHSDGIYRCNEKTDSEELVSNFTISLNGLVEVAKEAGGPGYQEEEEDQFYLPHKQRRMFSMIRLADMKLSNFDRVLNSSPYLQRALPFAKWQHNICATLWSASVGTVHEWHTPGRKHPIWHTRSAWNSVNTSVSDINPNYTSLVTIVFIQSV